MNNNNNNNNNNSNNNNNNNDNNNNNQNNNNKFSQKSYTIDVPQGLQYVCTVFVFKALTQ